MVDVEVSVSGVVARLPRPYQMEGIRWLREKERAFLTDGFGLGKTAQAIWAAMGTTMVACPSTLLNHWRREILAIYPDARVVLASAPTTAGRKAQMAVDADFYVFNIEMLRTDVHLWFNKLKPVDVEGTTGVGTLIIDEAHRLRGRTSLQYAGAMSVATRVRRLYLLTATPVYNQPNDLFALLRLAAPARFTSYHKFCDTFLKVLHTPWGPSVVGIKKGVAGGGLKTIFAEYAMGRTREDVKAQLPALQETVLELTPDADFYKMYEKIKSTYRDQYEKRLMSSQSVLQALRGVTQTAKIEMVAQLITDSCAGDTLVYTYHRDLAFALGHLLKVPVITGAMPPAERERVARGNDFVVATFPSVSEGLDFSHMKNVMYVEHDWQPGLMQQSLNRVHRPTSSHTNVNVYHILVKNTADAVIYRAYKKRSISMDEIVQAALVPFNDTETEEADAV